MDDTTTAEKHEMRVMGSQGDIKIQWDPNSAEEVEIARTEFNQLRRKNFLAFAVDRRGNKGEQITEFDPDAEKIILAPQIRGGI